MKASKSKLKLSTDEICREYYESQIFHLSINEETSSECFFVDAKAYIQVFDTSFEKVDTDSFLKEIMAVNIELFGVAWLNHNYKLSQELSMPDSTAPEEIVFTKRYLHNTGKADIWKIMGSYNDAIMKTAVEEKYFGGWRRFRDIPKAIRAEDYEKFLEKELFERLEFWSGWFTKFSTDSECNERFACRGLVIPCDNVEIVTTLSQKFSLALIAQLGCDLNQTGLFTLQRIIVGLYDNAVDYLNAVREWGSYKAAKDAREDTLKLVKNWIAHRKQQK